jgi:hypothetical protein
MLRVTTIHANTAGASARYYTRYLADEGRDGEGYWLGRQASHLGLSGAVSAEGLEAPAVWPRPHDGDTAGPGARRPLRHQGPADPRRRRVRWHLLGAQVGVGVVGSHRGSGAGRSA